MRLLRWLAPMACALLVACSANAAAPNFTLLDDAGAPWSLAAQHGTPVTIFFGFTHCADTCPLTLAKLVKASNGSEGTIAFVTVDPQRDTPAVMHAFLRRFHSSRLVGLTGTLDQILAVESAYHVWAQRIPGKHGGDDYDEAHASSIFYVDGNGRIAAIGDASDSVAAMAHALRAAS